MASPPVPEMSLATVTTFDRLICRVPSLITAPLPSEPAAELLPMLSVPAEIVVVPL